MGVEIDHNDAAAGGDDGNADKDDSNAVRILRTFMTSRASRPS